MVFDLEKGSTLYIDLAKSNSRSKRLRAGILQLERYFLIWLFPLACSSNESHEIMILQSDDESQGSEKRLKGSVAFSRSDDPGKNM